MAALDYDIAIYAGNEAALLKRCLISVDRAGTGARARVTVILNGTTDESAQILESLRLANASLAVYRIAAMDKSNAINQFLSKLRSEAEAHIAVDAYTSIAPQALRALTAALRANPKANIASGVPGNGRSAAASRARILAGGTVCGCLHAIRPSFVDRLTAAGLRLPLRLYRGDGLLGSLASHDLDAIGRPWDNARVVGVADAQFEIVPLSIRRWSDIKHQYRREIRQARGRYENEAIKSIIYSKGYDALPEDANAMIAAFVKKRRLKPRSARERYFAWLALRQLDGSRIPPDDLVPQLLFRRDKEPAQVAMV